MDTAKTPTAPGARALGLALAAFAALCACDKGAEQRDVSGASINQHSTHSQNPATQAEHGASEATPAPPSRAATTGADAPRWLLVPWGSQLYLHPEASAQTLTLADPRAAMNNAAMNDAELGQAGAVVELLETREGWRRVRSVDDRTLRNAGLREVQPVETLARYALELYLPEDVGAPISATSQAQISAGSGKQPKPEDALESARDDYFGAWELDPGSDVYWPDGTLAGAVACRHGFETAGELRETAAGALRCFEVALGEDPLELCFDPQSLHEGGAMPNQQLQPLDIPNKHNKTKNKTKDQDSDYASGTSGSGGTVRLQAAEATGIDAELARRTIRAHLAELRACYEQAHAKGLAGKVSLSLSVDRRGAVSEAAARGFDEQTARCVSEQAKTWSFAVGQRSEIEIFMEFALR